MNTIENALILFLSLNCLINSTATQPMKSVCLTIILTFLLSFLGFSQDSGSPLCQDALPICGTSSLTFPNTFDNTPAESGPNYGCLATQPNPAWFYLQIGQSGSIELLIRQSTSPGGSPDLDVDFILYGPFTDIEEACESELTASNIVDCSYSPDSVESVVIPNGVAGELYLLLITNFSGEQGYISVFQTSGTGATDCSILSIIEACEGNSITLDATTENAAFYTWYEEDLANPGTFNVIPGITTATYEVFTQKRYRAEASINELFILETYEFSAVFYEVPTAPSSVSDYNLCDNIGSGIDGVAQFNLLSKVLEILNGEDPSVFEVSFHEQQVDAENGVNPLDPIYNNTTNPQTIYARIYNSLVSDDLECYEVVPFNLVINSVPNIEGLDASSLNQIFCENDGDDLGVFDLNLAIDEVEYWLDFNGEILSNFNISLHLSQADADFGNNAITNISNYVNESSPGVTENPQTIYVRIEDTSPTSLICTNTNVNFQLEVFDAAIATAPSQHYIICDNTLDDGIDTGFGLFNLSSVLNNDGYDYVGTTGLTLHEEILSNLPSNADPLDFSISFYSTQEGADSGEGHPDQLTEEYVNVNPFLQDLYIRVENMNSQGICFDTAMMTLEVLPLPIFNLLDEYILCTSVNGTELMEFPELDTQLDNNQYFFEWFIDGVLEPNFNGMSSITAVIPGEYSVVVTNAVTGCTNEVAAEDTYTAMVYESSPPTVTAEIANHPFTENNSIQVVAEGAGIAQYEFSLNSGPWFLGETSGSGFSHVFTEEDNILLGDNVIRVRDVNGCGWTDVQVTVMDYPLYFTPNGDGINDTWNIYGMDDQVNAIIYIYDRFGKLLKSISPLGSGWDGTFNGEIMPSNDYWFTVIYDRQGSSQSFNSHFALKR